MLKAFLFPIWIELIISVGLVRYFAQIFTSLDFVWEFGGGGREGFTKSEGCSEKN